MGTGASSPGWAPWRSTHYICCGSGAMVPSVPRKTARGRTYVRMYNEPAQAPSTSCDGRLLGQGAQAGFMRTVRMRILCRPRGRHKPAKTSIVPWLAHTLIRNQTYVDLNSYDDVMSARLQPLPHTSGQLCGVKTPTSCTWAPDGGALARAYHCSTDSRAPTWRSPGTCIPL